MRRAGDRGRTGDVQLGKPFLTASKIRAVARISPACVRCVTRDDPECADERLLEQPPGSSCLTAWWRCVGERWAYLKVIASVLWPISSRMVFRSTPAIASRDAKVCR